MSHHSVYLAGVSSFLWNSAETEHELIVIYLFFDLCFTQSFKLFHLYDMGQHYDYQENPITISKHSNEEEERNLACVYTIWIMAFKYQRYLYIIYLPPGDVFTYNSFLYRKLYYNVQEQTYQTPCGPFKSKGV